MTYPKLALALLVLILVQACEQPDRYPVSGENCGPEDAVLDLNVESCAPAV